MLTITHSSSHSRFLEIDSLHHMGKTQEKLYVTSPGGQYTCGMCPQFYRMLEPIIKPMQAEFKILFYYTEAARSKTEYNQSALTAAMWCFTTECQLRFAHLPWWQKTEVLKVVVRERNRKERTDSAETTTGTTTVYDFPTVPATSGVIRAVQPVWLHQVPSSRGSRSKGKLTK